MQSAVRHEYQQEIYNKAVSAFASMVGSEPRKPLLYGADNKPLPPSTGYQYSRTAAKRAGSMKNWVPQRLLGRTQEAQQREEIAARAIDLTNNDPNVAGVVSSFASTIVGSGLVPHPMLNAEAIGISDKKIVRRIQAQQAAVYQIWDSYADAGGRMTFGGIQNLIQRNLIQFGEFILLLHMLDDPTRPYSLACQVIHPLRMKTPVDLVNNPNIRDGVELGEYGEPIAYWIKKSATAGVSSVLADVSANFLRIPAKIGHRWNVIHGFYATEPEQVRGICYFAPAMKFFRDFNDLLDAELVSNIVTAAMALFIEQETGNPYDVAANISDFNETILGSDGRSQTVRYQEWVPGQIMYGNKGEKPVPITATRPGVTFEPFTKILKKSMSMAVDIPYPVQFSDTEGTSFAGFRSAMLAAWRVYMMRRVWLGQGPCQKTWAMLQEEAYLRGDIEIDNFYSRYHHITRAEWRGSPKGDIEPIKAAQADKLLIESNLKTRAESIAERGGDIRTTFDQLEEEQEMMKERGLTDQPIDENTFKDKSTDEEVDDMGGAGDGLDQS
jgi:lambda family phage portal protein